MNKKIIILLIIGVILLTTVVLGAVFINKNNTEKFDMSGKKHLANDYDKNENIEVVTTIANENVISPNEELTDNEIYILKENDGYIAIYKLNEEGKEILIKSTGVITSYLPEVDMLELRKGIKVVGKENLNARLEDYE